MEERDFLELSQTPTNLEIDEDIGDLLLEDTDVSALEGFEYPALLLTGVLFQDTLKVIKTCARKSYREVAIWLDLEDGSSPTMIGTLPLELDTLLVMRYLGVRVIAYFSQEKVEPLDLSDTEVLEKYM